jgi:hypothetical protein
VAPCAAPHVHYHGSPGGHKHWVPEREEDREPAVHRRRARGGMSAEGDLACDKSVRIRDWPLQCFHEGRVEIVFAGDSPGESTVELCVKISGEAVHRCSWAVGRAIELQALVPRVVDHLRPVVPHIGARGTPEQQQMLLYARVLDANLAGNVARHSELRSV